MCLPEEFVEHALARGLEAQRLPAVDFDHLGQRDRSWPGAEFELLAWTPDPPRRDDAPDVDPDPAWWLRQAALVNEDHSGSDTPARRARADGPGDGFHPAIGMSAKRQIRTSVPALNAERMAVEARPGQSWSAAPA